MLPQGDDVDIAIFRPDLHKYTPACRMRTSLSVLQLSGCESWMSNLKKVLVSDSL